MWWLLACTGEPEAVETEETDAACDSGFVLDGDACVPERCGTGMWGSIADPDVFVAEGADGDGSEGAPYGTIGEAMENLGRSGGVIAVAAGTYGRLAFEDRIDGVRVEGRCPDLVSLVDDSERDPTVLVDQLDPATPPVLGGVTITGGTPGQGGVWVYRGTLTLHDIEVVDNDFIGVLVKEAGTAVLERVAIRGTRLDQGEKFGGRGLEVDGGTVHCTDCVIEDNEQVGVFAALDADVTLTRGRVSDTRSTNAENGQGVLAADGSTVRLDGTEIARNKVVNAVALGGRLELAGVRVTDALQHDGQGDARGVLVDEAGFASISGSEIRGNPSGAILVDHGSTLDIADCLVTGNGANLASGAGYGLVSQRGSTIRGSGVTLDGNAGTQLVALFGGAILDVSKVAVTGTEADEGGIGRAMEVGEGASGTCTACTFDGNTQVGALVSTGGTLTLVDSVVSNTRPAPDGTGGFGVVAFSGSTLVLYNSDITGNRGFGVDVESATATIEGCRIADTLPMDEGVGAGLALDPGASVSVLGTTIDRSSLLGVSSRGALLFEDSAVSNTLPNEAGLFGRGLVHAGGAATIRRSRFLSNREIAVMATEPGTTLELDEVTITGVAASAGQSAPVGVVAQDGASILATALHVTDMAGPGLYVVVGGEMSCAGCVLERDGFAGAVVLAGSLALVDSTVGDNTIDASGRGGVGVYASDREGPGALSVTSTVIGAHPYAGVWLTGPGRYELEDVTITGGTGLKLRGIPVHGNAVYADGGIGPWDGSTGLRMTGGSLEDSGGPALFLDGASATLEDVGFSGNTVDVRQQRCEGVDPPVGAAGTIELCPVYNDLTVPLDFEIYLSEISATGG